MQLYYSPSLSPAGYCTLDAEESRHAVRVMRLRNGDRMHVTDGRGQLILCTIAVADERACVVEPLEVISAPCTRPRLTVAVAPTKNPSRMEWLVEKAVEVGVDEIVLLQCERSERTFLKTDRLGRVALSAMKQSLHTTLPTIANMPFGDFAPAEGLRLIAHCDADTPRCPLMAALTPGLDATILIGPEGDFSDREIAHAMSLGCQPVSLGPSRLRTETAALYAAVAFNLVNDNPRATEEN